MRGRDAVDVLVQMLAHRKRGFALHVGGAIDQIREWIDVLLRTLLAIDHGPPEQ